MLCALRCLDSGAGLVAGSINGKLARWDIRHPKTPLLQFQGETGECGRFRLDVDASETFLVSGSRSPSVRHWNLRSGALVQETCLGPDPVPSVVIAENMMVWAGGTEHLSLIAATR